MLTRHTLPVVLSILALLVVGNCVLFFAAPPASPHLIAKVLDADSFFWLFTAAYLALTVFLCAALCDRGGRQNYLLHRLRISPAAVYRTQAVYNTVCYVLLFALEALSLLGLCALCGVKNAGWFTSQTLLLLCYQSDMLHSFFPLANVAGWLALASQLVGLGICTASFSVYNRRGKTSVLTFFMAAAPLAYVLINRKGSALDPTMPICNLFFAVFVAGISLLSALSMEVEPDA